MTIVVEQHVVAAPSTVYRYLTESDLWALWQGVDADLDARVGGRFSMTMVNGMNATGEFVELVPDERVVFTWGWVGHTGIPPGSTTVEISLRPDGDGTRIVLRHSSVPPDEASFHESGWRRYLPRLAEATTGETPDPDIGPM